MLPFVARLSACMLASGASGWPLAPFLIRPISPAGEGNYRETLLAADIDKDGHPDFFSGEGRGAKTWWFQRTLSGWQRRLVSDSNLTDVDAAMLDVDGDGWIDKIASGYWYRNPGFPAGGLAADAPDRAFALCRYSGQEYIHDIYVADIDGDGRKDILGRLYPLKP